MTDLTLAFGNRVLSRLIDATPRPDGVRAWITNSSYTIQPSAEKNTFVLLNVERPIFLDYLLFDYQRFLLACMESVVASNLVYFTPKAVAWPLLKKYYAAFFGAHALMRITGRGVIRLEAAQSDFLTEIGQAVIDPGFSVQSGSYFFELQEVRGGNPNILFRKLPTKRSSAHEIFWSAFQQFLSAISKDVVEKGEPDALLIVARIDELQQILRASDCPGGNWLSVIRNKVNYQHLFGVWFPFRSATPSGNRVAFNVRSNSAVRLDFDFENHVIDAFEAASLFIASINFDVANHMIKFSTSKRAIFIREWNRLIRDAAVA